MTGITVYGLPHCSTCQKVVATLEAGGAAPTAYHDLKASPLSRERIAELAAKAGGAGALFSRRALKYRQMGLHERVLSEEEMLDLMAQEYTFITRPVLERGDRAVAGNRPRQLQGMLASG